MAKKVLRTVKIQALGGSATPAPPLGPALGGAGINIGEFVKQFNDRTQDKRGEVVPAVITVYEDRSFDFILKTTPASKMILKAIGQSKGSGKNTTKKVGSISKSQIKEIAENKMADLNASSIESAMKIIEGTCRSMGVEVK